MTPMPLSTLWTDELAFDVALALECNDEESVQALAGKHEIAASTLASHLQNPVFTRRVNTFREQIQKEGVAFGLKAKVQAAQLLDTAWNIIHDVEVPPVVRAKMIADVVRWAGFDKPAETPVQAAGGGVRININFGDASVGQRNISVDVTADAEPASLTAQRSPDDGPDTTY